MGAVVGGRARARPDSGALKKGDIHFQIGEHYLNLAAEIHLLWPSYEHFENGQSARVIS